MLQVKSDKIVFFAAAAVTLLCVSCSKKSVKPVAENPAEKAGETSFVVPENSEIPVDFDLTHLNANMVYAQVFDMMINPETYENKYLKMKGKFAVYGDNVAGSKAYSVIISDALACCQQGIEFHYDFNGNEPAPDKEITVTGKFLITELQSGISYNFVQAEMVEF